MSEHTDEFKETPWLKASSKFFISSLAKKEMEQGFLNDSYSVLSPNALMTSQSGQPFDDLGSDVEYQTYASQIPHRRIKEAPHANNQGQVLQNSFLSDKFIHENASTFFGTLDSTFKDGASHASDFDSSLLSFCNSANAATEYMFPNLSGQSIFINSQESRIIKKELHSKLSLSTLPTMYKSPEQAYIELIPLLNSVSHENFGYFLVGVLQRCSEELSLDNFYKMLYNPKFYTSVSENLRQDTNLLKPVFHLADLKLCFYVLETFRPPHFTAGLFADGLVHNSKLSSINTHEFLRTFLALKIIFDCFEKTDDDHSSLPRILTYKAYYILCQILISRNSASLLLYRLQQNIVFCQSGLGKIMRLAFPDLTTKRLGKRGQSRSHILGLRWKRPILSEDIWHLMEFDILEIKKHFVTHIKGSRRQQSINLQFKASRDRHNGDRELKDEIAPTQSLTERMKPFYSFVDASNKYPSFDCSPRLWKCILNTHPAPSEWSKNIMVKSIDTLKLIGIHIEPLVNNFASEIFSKNKRGILESCVSQVIKGSNKDPPSVKPFLHLCLVIFLLAFPLIIASDREICGTKKAKLRSYLNSIIALIMTERQRAPPNEGNMMKFTWILKKMIHISELTLSKVHTNLIIMITDEMIRDLDKLDENPDSPNINSISPVAFYVRNIFMWLRAYNYDGVYLSGSSCEEALVEIVLRITQAFLKEGNDFRQFISNISMSMSNEERINVTYDLPFELFRILAQFLHQDCLSDHLVLKLPISAIKFLVLSATNEIQNVSFSSVAERDEDVSRQTFKTWWVLSTILQEYMIVLSEIAALSGNLF
ncbi:hypothetical protein METBIDRAFT_10258 [Metschnikowia bicuspidata var. bicuspidata NRRL YB-4993]|uniref:RFX-type winged-helix domain-containing protein n=1 Tax=Metschnikowia bicuspidata var. bicuspidata NRRL YB-4993 TaxID=869754 RepID=A0A1A0HJA6_9ASCO|nr:hypothetical protein METBIDRAFT_10258 [Metschnikowia bicuspidata var. bicuspidata NRRL YB-4993]OBA24081.1 hypothetical protein METBIDRAFT_10258 [Metschnikowia bicuspidata var. bicuspidata NRRL YB-4993]